MPRRGFNLHHIAGLGPNGIAGQRQDLLRGFLGTASTGSIAVKSALHLPQEGDLDHSLTYPLFYDCVLNHGILPPN
ncbi:hypothetical protein I4100191B2_15740 [Clostridiales bacterium]